MVRRGRWICVAVILAGSNSHGAAAREEGLRDRPVLAIGEDNRAKAREFYAVTTQAVEPSRLPKAVTRAALEAVAGLKVHEAYRVRHRPITYFGKHTEFNLKGRDASGREVSVRTNKDGTHPTVTRSVPLGHFPTGLLAEGLASATKDGYTPTSGLVVTWNARSARRESPHTLYYLKGIHRDRPGVEEIVWDSPGDPKQPFGLRDLDDMLWKIMAID